MCRSLRLGQYINAEASACLRDHSGKCYHSICIVIGDTPLMPGDNGFRSRQANAIAASGAGAGGICPVEAVKVPGELVRIHPCAWVGYGNTDVSSPHGHKQADCPRRVTVFDRVVQKDGKEPEQVVLDASQLHAGGDLRRQRIPLRLRQNGRPAVRQAAAAPVRNIGPGGIILPAAS